jgi:hypothetical protein
MKRALLSALVALAPLASSLRAQVVETPEPFDSAGRVMAITPRVAAALRLSPPAWRVTGDYREARLFALGAQGAEGYVIVVTRRSGVLERYPISREDRAYLRERTASLPPSVQEQLGEGLGRAERNLRSASRNAFVRNQALLGLLAYGPGFAGAVTDNAAAGTAAYVVVAGATLVGATELARSVRITEAMNELATGGGLTGALMGAGLAHAVGGSRDEIWAGLFLGGVGGSAGGLYFGRDMTVGEAHASTVGATLATTLAGIGLWGAKAITDTTYKSSFKNLSKLRIRRSASGILVASAAAGFPLGALYARTASYNVTPGDVDVMTSTGTIGFLAGSIFTGGSGGEAGKAVALATGTVLGLAVGDRRFVRRFDHSRAEASLVAIGTGAGALMAAGLGALFDREGRNPGLTSGLAAAGGIVGLSIAEQYAQPGMDAGHMSSRLSHLEVNPMAIGMAAARVPGNHPVLGISF